MSAAIVASVADVEGLIADGFIDKGTVKEDERNACFAAQGWQCVHYTSSGSGGNKFLTTHFPRALLNAKSVRVI